MSQKSAAGIVSDYRCASDCRSKGHEFDPGPVPYFCGDWSWIYFYGHSPPFRWFIQEGLWKYVQEVLVNPLLKLAQEKVCLGELTAPLTIAVDWGVKHQNKQTQNYSKTLIRGHV